MLGSRQHLGTPRLTGGQALSRRTSCSVWVWRAAQSNGMICGRQLFGNFLSHWARDRKSGGFVCLEPSVS